MTITPGPNNMMLTASGANFGYRRTLPQIFGITAGGFAMTVASCLGLGALFAAWPAAQAALRIAGAAYLLWLAWKLTRAQLGSSTASRPFSFVEGALFQLVNPKGWIKAVTLGSVFMPPGPGMIGTALLMATVGAVVVIPCVSVWAMFGVAIARFLREPGRQRVFNFAMAATLAALALLFLR
jgi:threonine/homoserine/homoserine lactone efflux protein